MQQTQQPEAIKAAIKIIITAIARKFIIPFEGSRKGIKNLTRKKRGVGAEKNGDRRKCAG
jgi:hypothetical protein